VAETQTPDYQSAEFARFCPLWDKVDACPGGTEAMRAAGMRSSIGDSGRE